MFVTFKCYKFYANFCVLDRLSYSFYCRTLKNPYGEVLRGGGTDGFMTGRTILNKGSSNVTVNVSVSWRYIHLLRLFYVYIAL